MTASPHRSVALNLFGWRSQFGQRTWQHEQKSFGIAQDGRHDCLSSGHGLLRVDETCAWLAYHISTSMSPAPHAPGQPRQARCTTSANVAPDRRGDLGDGSHPAVSRMVTPDSMIAAPCSSYGTGLMVGRIVRLTPKGWSVSSRSRKITRAKASGVG